MLKLLQSTALHHVHHRQSDYTGDTASLPTQHRFELSGVRKATAAAGPRVRSDAQSAQSAQVCSDIACGGSAAVCSVILWLLGA